MRSRETHICEITENGETIAHEDDAAGVKIFAAAQLVRHGLPTTEASAITLAAATNGLATSKHGSTIRIRPLIDQDRS